MLENRFAGKFLYMMELENFSPGLLAIAVVTII